jgi:hypothetical protein
MKTICLLTLSVVALGCASCTQDPPPKTVYHHTTVYRDSGPSVGTPTNEGSDNFHAVTKPDTYSGQ